MPFIVERPPPPHPPLPPNLPQGPTTHHPKVFIWPITKMPRGNPGQRSLNSCEDEPYIQAVNKSSSAFYHMQDEQQRNRCAVFLVLLYSKACSLTHLTGSTDAPPTQLSVKLHLMQLNT